MQTPQPDWFPSRLDLRKARRWERTRMAVAGNLLFLAFVFLLGWFGVRKSEGIFLLTFLAGFVIALTTRFHSFIRIAEREQLEDLSRRLGLKGCHVTCQFVEGDFVLGSDVGYLARDGGMLRFEGVTSRFAISRASLTQEPNLDVRNPTLELDSIRIQIKPDRDTDVDATSVYLNRWLRDGGAVDDERLPPQTPQQRSWGWYFDRTVERNLVLLSFAMLATHFRLLFPESLKKLRLLILGLPIAALAVFMVRAVFKLRREDQEWLAQRATSAVTASEGSLTMPSEIPQSVTTS